MNRRDFIRATGVVAGGSLAMDGSASALVPLEHFKVSVISDGLSDDFETCLKTLQSYKLKWVEIRTVWGKYNTDLGPADIHRLKELLLRYDIRCSQVDTALYKCTLPGTTPISDLKPIYPYEQQIDMLKRAIERAHAWGTDRLRVFAFWRVSNPATIANRIREELEKSAEIARTAGVRLTLENEYSTNIGTVRELAEALKHLPPNVGANYDIGNGVRLGEVSYPSGYETLDARRIWNIHVKGLLCNRDFTKCHETAADEGQIDLKGQLKALLRDGYHEPVSLECEYAAAGLDHGATTRRSLEGLLRVVSQAVND